MLIFEAFSSPLKKKSHLQWEHLKNTEGGNHWKQWFNWKCLPVSPTTPCTTTSEAPTPADQKGVGVVVVPFDPRGRQRWKECVVQPVITLTQTGGKKLPTSSFSHRLEAPPVTHGGKEEGGRAEEELGGWGGGERRLQRDGKGIGWWGEKGEEEESGWPAKKPKTKQD